MKCPSCEGSGSAFRDVDSKKYGPITIHEPCGECAGTGLGVVAEAARGIQEAFWVTLGGPMSCMYARKRRAKIARFVASAVMAHGRREAGKERGDEPMQS